MLKLCWLIVALLPLLSFPRPVQAQQELKVYPLAGKEEGTELSPFVYFYEDKQGKRGLAQVNQPQFKRFKLNKKRTMAFSYTDSAVWLRFAVANASDQDRQIAIRIDYPLLDEISFYDAGKNGYVETISGDAEPFASRWLKYRNFAFPSTIEAGETKIYYIRVKSSSSVTVPLQIWDASTLKEHATDEGPAFGLYFGCMIAILLYNLFIFASTRSRTYLVYVAFITSSVFFYLSWMGVGPMYLWGDNQWLTQRVWPVSAGIMVFFSMCFLYLFVDLETNSPRLARVHRFLTLLVGSIALCNAVFPLSLAHRLGFIAGGLGAFYAFAVASYMTVKKNRQAMFYFIAWSAFLSFIGLSALTVMGVLALPIVIGSFGSQMGSALEAILLSLGLADRINVMKKKELEQSNHIIEGLSRIQIFRDRLETLLTATKQMSEYLEKTHALQAASRHIQKELSNLETRHVWYLEQDEKTGDVRRLVLVDDPSGQDEAWQMEWLDARSCVRNQREIIVPVMWKGLRFGVFCIGVSNENAPLPSEDVNFLETMMQSLALSLQNIDYQNNLKEMVDARTLELNTALGSLTDRQRKIDDILGNIEQGIFTFDENFRIGGEYSQHLLEIFKIKKSEMQNLTINDLLFKNTDMSLDKQNTVVESLKSSVGVEDFIWDANTHHLPHEITKNYGNGSRSIELEWKPLVSMDAYVDQVMVVAKDVTERRALQKKVEEGEESRQRFIQILTRMVSVDRSMLVGYFIEMRKDIRNIHDEIKGSFNDTHVFRMLHTMKGLSRSLKFDSLSALIHACEGVIVEHKNNPQQRLLSFGPKFATLEGCFGEYLQVYDQVFSTQVSDLHHWNLMIFLAQMLPERLDAIRAQHYPIEAISCDDRVMNWNVSIVSDVREILMHLFNNSLDHGFLLPFGQQLVKKPIQVELSARLVDDAVEIILEDYGAGVAIEKLVAKARMRGIAFDEANPYDLIFHDGLSTSQKATMTSGRGVGLSAVRSRVAELGGTIAYGSADHVGTRFVIRIPKESALADVADLQKVS